MSDDMIQPGFFTRLMRRTRRTHYFLWVLALAFCGVLIEVTTDDAVILLAGVAVLALLVPAIMAGIGRAHDTGHSGWLVALTFIPLLGLIPGLYLLFARGTKGANPYGPDPRQPEPAAATGANYHWPTS
jgi:uncharacterized membrane protein YhaH (DUF805 family)